MNELILNTGVQYFIRNFKETDTLSVLLQKPLFPGIQQKELVEQLAARKKCRDKLPTWFHTPQIYYPNKLNIEQTSSEHTALYKANLIHGKSLLDLTGGFGVDTYFFSEKIPAITHCEINEKLSAIAAHNFEVLGRKNIRCLSEDGIAFLENTRSNFDWIYVDPSRRSDVKGKVFLLKDCLPNIPEHLPLLFEKSKHILLKVSPLLDIKKTIAELSFVKEVHVVGLKNEVKELLFILEKDYLGTTMVKTTNLLTGKDETFSFALEEETVAESSMGNPEKYLYEPNTTILKSGAFKLTGKKFGLHKLHPNSHLYTSSKLKEFPGRIFKVVAALPYSKSSLKAFKDAKANITIRNFPISVAALRKKHKIKDGGSTYLFFTKDMNDKLIVLECEKISSDIPT